MNEKPLTCFYDIESLTNVFSVAVFWPTGDPNRAHTAGKQHVDMYYLTDGFEDTQKFRDDLKARIYERNYNFKGSVDFLNLKEESANRQLAMLMGVCDTKNVNKPQFMKTPDEVNALSVEAMNRYRNFNVPDDVTDPKKDEQLRYLAYTGYIKNQETYKYEASTFPPEFRPICDTDNEPRRELICERAYSVQTQYHPAGYIDRRPYDPKRDPYIMGYNSALYDTTMLAIYFNETWTGTKEGPKTFQPIEASFMRTQNDRLFNEFKKNMPGILSKDENGEDDWNKPQRLIRKSMQMSGRHIDVARLNEKQSRMGLKRMLGMLGCQILESNKLRQGMNTLENEDQLCDLLAYNVSDVVNLDKLFNHPFYQGQFELKAQLLQDYPELVYDNNPNATGTSKFKTRYEVVNRRNNYTPIVDSAHVRNDRLSIMSSSAQFSTTALCPYGHLSDLPFVEFVYPTQRRCDEFNRENNLKPGDKRFRVPKNILEECNAFYHKLYDGTRIENYFEPIYRYYRSIQYRNFDNSTNYEKDAKYENVPDSKWLEIGRYIISDAIRDMNDAKTALDADIVVDGNNWIAIREYAKEALDTIDPNNIQIKDVKQYVTKCRNARDIPKRQNCIFYYDHDADPTSCVANFSIGGIHGAEANINLFNADMREWKAKRDLIEEAKALFNGDHLALRKARKFTDSKGVEHQWKEVLPSGYTIKNADTKGAWRDVSAERPQMFITDNAGKHLSELMISSGVAAVIGKDPRKLKIYEGALKLSDKYTFTSSDRATHEDFTSYYPNMLRMLDAFYNDGLGYDRYNEIFQNKQTFQKLKKDKSLPAAQRAVYSVQREGTKLILNSASGAGDTLASSKFGYQHESPIQMNNRIMSMRIIGQLFSWRIGQWQAYHGARITSTNTDGLYSADLPQEENDRLLFEEADGIGVDIEPEPMWLISKDANNRIELNADDHTDVLSASGGTLACRNGMNPTKALAHPALIDWALSEYLIDSTSNPQVRLDRPFNRVKGRELLERARHEFSSTKFLELCGNVLAASDGLMTYIFGTTKTLPESGTQNFEMDCINAWKNNEVKIMLHYTRVFVMKDSWTKDSWHLYKASCRVKTAAMKNSEENRTDNYLAKKVIAANTKEDIPNNKIASVTKINEIDPNWNMLIENRAIEALSEDERQEIISNLDMDAYLETLESKFTKNWMNVTYANTMFKTRATTLVKSFKKNVDKNTEPFVYNVADSVPLIIIHDRVAYTYDRDWNIVTVNMDEFWSWHADETQSPKKQERMILTA